MFNTTNGDYLNITGLNMDCILLIIEKLELPALTSIAETNKNFSYLAADAFRRKYSRKTIKIMGSFSIGSTKHIFYKNDEIEILDHEIVPKVLRNFGHLINSLRVDYTFLFESEIKNINQHINFYCSNTLINLDVHSGHEDFFDNMTRPFDRVTNVLVSGRFNSLGSKTLKLNELYPAIVNLTMKNIKVIDSSWVNLNFPHLKYICVDVSQNTDPRNAANYLSEADVDQLIKSNPQIESIRLGSITQNLLQMLANDLPKLEHLELESYDEWNSYNFEHREVRFDNVKRFEMESGSHSVPENITFNQLEEFKTDGFPDDCTRWIDLIKNTKSLRKVHVYERYIRNSELQRLAKANLQLIEISLWCGRDVEDETIVMFIKNSKQLMKLHLVKFTAPNSGLVHLTSLRHTANTLRQKFGDTWIIRDFDSDIFLERNIYKRSSFVKGM